MLEKVKVLLGIQDPEQDQVLEQIISNVSSHLTVLLGKTVPENLHFVVIEISVMRFNRLGSEGMKSELTEGHRADFFEPAQEFRPYLSIIEQEKAKDNPVTPARGRVMFI